MARNIRTTTLKKETSAGCVLDDFDDEDLLQPGDFDEDLFDPACGEITDEGGFGSSVDVPLCLGCLVPVDKCICQKKAESFLHRHNP